MNLDLLKEKIRNSSEVVETRGNTVLPNADFLESKKKLEERLVDGNIDKRRLSNWEKEENNPKEEIAYENSRITKDFLGKPVVSVKKVLEEKTIIEGKDVYCAIVNSNGDNLFVGIDPEYLDHRKIMEGDTAVYIDPFLVAVVDKITPTIKIPKVSFDATDDPTVQVVGGLEEQILELKEILGVFDKKERKRMIENSIMPVRGVLLYGYSGTGKTMLAKASANYAKVPFFYINTPELFKAHLGETVEEIKTHFLVARKNAPSILYFDEITRLGAMRSYSDGGAEKEVAGATEEFQAQMNGLNENGLEDSYVLVMGSSNLAHIFDSAVLSRFDIHIEIPVPDFEAKKKIITAKINNIPHNDLSAHKIAEMIEKINPLATGRNIEDITNYAKRKAYRENTKLSMEHYISALKIYSKRVDVPKNV